MKDLKSFNSTDMGIDGNDLKILLNASFQHLIKSCHQWAKDHPYVSWVLLFFYVLYIFFPSLFSLIFYTFPLVICTAILLGESQIRPKKHHDHQNICTNNNVTSNYHHHHRPYMQHQMSKRTFGKTNKDKYGDDDPHEDNGKNMMDLGSSEIERDKRLESLIAKRKARKMLSMQPRRNNHIDYLGDYNNHNNSHDHHIIGNVGSIMVTNAMNDNDNNNNNNDYEHQPGSAPSVLLTNRSPFDLPYDLYEEKPILTGGSFEEEFFANVIGELKEDPVSKCHPSFFSKPRANDKPGYSRFRRESDAEENMKKILEELAQEGNDQTPYEQESTQEVQLGQIQNECHDQATTSPQEDEEFRRLKVYTSSHNIEPTSNMVNSIESKKVQELEAENKSDDEFQLMQDQPSLTDHHDDGKTRSSSSSSSCLCEIEYNATNNEAFTNSVKKVLVCLSKNKGLMKRERTNVSSSKPMSHANHKHNNSIASDMQVEVSDTDPTSPVDRDSFMYDGDVDKDVDSGDDDPWGASPHPLKLGDFETQCKLINITHESQDPSDQEAKRRITTSSPSLRSISPKVNHKDVIDHNNIGDVVSSHVRDPSVEEITMQDEINPIFELDEDKEDLKESDEQVGSHQGIGEQNSDNSQSQAPDEENINTAVIL